MDDEHYLTKDQICARLQRFHDILWKDFLLFAEMEDIEMEPVIKASYAAQQETIQKLIDEYLWLFESITVRQC